MSAAPGVAAVQTALPRAIRWLAAAVFLIAIPVFLITTNVRLVAADRQFIEDGFARHGVSARTGLTPAQLRDVARAFVDYFRAPPGVLDVQVELAGSRRPLFNRREIDHMVDVQRLMHLVERLQVLTGAAIVAIALLGFAVVRRPFARLLGRLLQAGAALTAAVLLLLGGLSLLDFGEVFLQFHLLSFSNDLWILDPERDYLLMLFPEGFWFDATLRIALLTAIEAVALGLLGLGLRVRGAHR